MTFHRLHAALALACLLVGCSSEDTSAPRAQPTTERIAFERGAHREALAHARTLSESALTAADPLAAWACCGGELAPPHLSAQTLARAREDGRRARREATDIQPAHLELDEVVVLRVLEFGLERLETRAHGQPPSRNDPGYLVDGLRPLLDALETHAARGSCADCAAALRAIAVEASAAGHDLAACSMPALEAAIADLQALAVRLEALGKLAPELLPVATETAASLRAVAVRWEEQRGNLRDASTASWQAKLRPAENKPLLARLPDRMGAPALVALLETEEASAEPLAHALDQLGRALARLRAMDARLEPPGVSEPTAVSVERCEQALARVRAWAEQSTPVPDHAPTCSALLELFEGEVLDDATLLLQVIARAWVDPVAADHRRTTGALVALVGGRIAPASHRLAASIAAASGMGDADATRLALAEAKHAACLAATALWVHGEIEDEARLRVLLAGDCPERTPDAWIEAALARPRRALEGMGLAFVEPGPAALAALERYSWAPLGLIPVLADPRILAPPPPTPLDVTFEEMTPDALSRSTSAEAVRAGR